MTTVIGLDLSLTSTGISDGETFAHVIRTRTPKTVDEQHLRLAEILAGIREVLRPDQAVAGADLVVIEGPSHGSVGTSAHERAGLWWLVAHELWHGSIPYAVVSPLGRAKYAVGKGSKDKDQVLAATVRRWPAFLGSNNNEADAWILARMGRDRLGLCGEELPAVNREALDKVHWPEGL